MSLRFLLALAVLCFAGATTTQPADPLAAGVCTSGTCEEGAGVMQYPDSTRYEGAWQNGLREGIGVLVHPEGWSWAGKWHNGAATLAGHYHFADGTTLAGALSSAFSGRPVDPAVAYGLTPLPTAEEPSADVVAPPVDVAPRRAPPAPATPTFERRPDDSVVQRLNDGTFRVTYPDGTRMMCSAVDMCDRTHQREVETRRRLGVE